MSKNRMNEDAAQFDRIVKAIFSPPVTEEKLISIPTVIDIFSQRIEGLDNMVNEATAKYFNDHFVELFRRTSKIKDNDTLSKLIRNSVNYIIQSTIHGIHGSLAILEQIMKIDIPSIPKNCFSIALCITTLISPRFTTLTSSILLLVTFIGHGGFSQLYKIINNSEDEVLVDEVCTFLEHMIAQYGSDDLKQEVINKVLNVNAQTIRKQRLAMFVSSEDDVVANYIDTLTNESEEVQKREIVSIFEEREYISSADTILCVFLEQLFQAVDHKNSKLITNMAKYLIEKDIMNIDLFLEEFKDQWPAFREIISEFNNVDDTIISQILLETSWSVEKANFMVDVLIPRPYINGLGKAFIDVANYSYFLCTKKFTELAMTHKYDSEFRQVIEYKIKMKPFYNEIRLMLSIMSVIGCDGLNLEEFVDYILYEIESIRILDLLNSFSFLPIKYPSEVIYLCPHTELFYKYISTHFSKRLEEFEEDVLAMTERDEGYINFLVTLYQNSNEGNSEDPNHRVLLWRAFFLSNTLKESSPVRKLVRKTVAELASNYPHLAFTDTMSLSPEERDFVVKQGDLKIIGEPNLENPLQQIQSIIKCPTRDNLNNLNLLIDHLPKTKESVTELFNIYTSPQFPPSLRTKELSRKIIQFFAPFPEVLAEYLKGFKQIPAIKRTVILPIDRHPLASSVIQAFATIPSFVMELIMSNDDFGLKLSNLVMYILFGSDAVVDPSSVFPENFWNGYESALAFLRMLPPNAMNLLSTKRAGINPESKANGADMSNMKISMNLGNYVFDSVSSFIAAYFSLYNAIILKAPEILIIEGNKCESEYPEEFDLEHCIDKRSKYRLHAILDKKGVYIKSGNKMISSVGQKLKTLPKNLEPLYYIYVREGGVTAEEVWAIVPEAYRSQIISDEMIASRIFSASHDFSSFVKNEQFFSLALSLLEKASISDAINAIKDSKEFAKYIFDGPIFSNPSFFKSLPNVVIELSKLYDDVETLIYNAKNHLKEQPDLCLSLINELMADPDERIAFIVDNADEHVHNQKFVDLIKKSMNVECDLYSLLFDCQTIRRIVLPYAPEYAAETYKDNWDQTLFDDILKYATSEFIDAFIALIDDQTELTQIATKLATSNSPKLSSIIEKLNGGTDWWLQNAKYIMITKDNEIIAQVIKLATTNASDLQKKQLFADVIKYTLGKFRPHATLYICSNYMEMLAPELAIPIMKYCFSKVIHHVECGIELFEYLLLMDVPTEAIKLISSDVLYQVQLNMKEGHMINETIYRFILLWMSSKYMTQWGTETESITVMVEYSNQNPASEELASYFVEHALQRVTDENRGYVTYFVYLFTSTTPTSVIYLPLFFETEDLSVFYENQIFVPILACVVRALYVYDMDADIEDMVYSNFVMMFEPIVRGEVRLQPGRMNAFYPGMSSIFSRAIEVIKQRVNRRMTFSALFFDFVKTSVGISSMIVDWIISNINLIVDMEVDESNASSYLGAIEAIMRTGFGDSRIVNSGNSPNLKALVNAYVKAVTKSAKILSEEAAESAVTTLHALISSNVTESVFNSVIGINEHGLFDILYVQPQTERGAQNLKRFMMALLRNNNWVDGRAVLEYIKMLNPDAHNIESLLTVAYIAIKKGRKECIEPFLEEIVQNAKKIMETTSNDTVKNSPIFKSL